MSFRREIAELDAAIVMLTSSLASRRRKSRTSPEIEKMLGALSRLKATRTRLMLRQSVVVKTAGAAVLSAIGGSKGKSPD
jgi:hypothetical protein